MFSLKSLCAGWNDFFFRPRPTEGIALFRIVWCSILLFHFFMEMGNVVDFFGPHAILSLETVKKQFTPFHANVFHLFGASYEAVYWVMAIYAVSLISALLGFRTRLSLSVALICLTSLNQRNIWLLNSADVLMRIMTILLICSPCGHSLSVDALLGRNNPKYRRDREWAPWALRLIQIQLSVVYLWTVWHKLKGNYWFDGTAVYYATRLENMTNFPLPFFLDSMTFLKLMTWGTLAIETALGTLIWFKEFRKPLIIAGMIFHLGIEYIMSIPFFEVVMIALLINFYEPEELKVFVNKQLERIRELLKKIGVSSSLKNKLDWLFQGEKTR